MITKKEFKEMNNKKPKYKILFEFFKKNKDKAFTAKELEKSICKKIGMCRGQLNVTLYVWTKVKYLENKTPYYMITEEGLKNTGKLKYVKDKKMYVSND